MISSIYWFVRGKNIIGNGPWQVGGESSFRFAGCNFPPYKHSNAIWYPLCFGVPGQETLAFGFIFRELKCVQRMSRGEVFCTAFSCLFAKLQKFFPFIIICRKNHSAQEHGWWGMKRFGFGEPRFHLCLLHNPALWEWKSSSEDAKDTILSCGIFVKT